MSAWTRKCPMCGAKLEKIKLEPPWKCWSCAWSTEDLAHGQRWDGVSQKPGAATGEHL